MHSVTFYYAKHQGLLELMFDDRQEAEKVLKQFQDGITEKGHTLCIESKYGKLVLSLHNFSAALLSNLEKTERLQVELVIRRSRIERTAKKMFDRWARTVDQLQSVVQMPPKPKQ